MGQPARNGIPVPTIYPGVEALRLRRAWWIVGFFVICAGLAPSAAAQSAGSHGDAVEDEPPRVSRVSFDGAHLFSHEQLMARVRTRSNRRLLGIPGFNWWLWMHRLGDAGTLGGAVSRALIATGEPPAYLDTTVVNADVERLQFLYHQEGFRDAEVYADIDTLSRESVRVTFRVEPGPPTYIRRVRFDADDGLDSSTLHELARGSLLTSRQARWADSTSFVAADRRFSEPMLLDERRRILTFLRDNGYAAVARDSITAVVFATQPDSFDVSFELSPGPRYRFGDIHYSVIGGEEEAVERRDTLVYESGRQASVAITNDSWLRPRLLYNSLQFEPGDWYDQSRLIGTRRRLEASGVFNFTDILPQFSTARRGDDGAPLLPHRIELRTRPRHQIRFETFMLQRSGVLGSENEIGAGIGATYENLNLFGGGETFRTSVGGSIAADVESRLFTSAQTEVSASLILPYLVSPFGGLDRVLDLYDARTRLSLNLLTARRDNLNLVIRGRGAALFRLEGQHTATLTSWLDLIDLSISNPDTLTGFRELFLDRVVSNPGGSGRPVLDPVQRAQILEDYTQPQINNALRYTLRAARVNPLTREQGYLFEAAIETGGNLPYALDRFVFSPGEVEGNLPGLPFFGGDRESRLMYRRYMRFMLDGRRYRPIGRGAVMAGKVVFGFAHPIGDSRVVPFDRRFYAGGGSSVRGWGLRLLGPGAASFGTDTGEELTNILGGDIKLEASVELRQRLIRNLLAADWVAATFVDAGNVWFGPRNPGFAVTAHDEDGRFRVPDFAGEIGVGAGIGLRLVWDYLIIRLDAAYKVHDPATTGLLPDGMRSPVIHFGIGHSF